MEWSHQGKTQRDTTRRAGSVGRGRWQGALAGGSRERDRRRCNAGVVSLAQHFHPP